MKEIIVTASLRAIKMFLAQLTRDNRLDKKEQWMASQALEMINRLERK